MHASFSMRGKSYKMIQSSSRINDENFLLVVKKMSHNHFEGERTHKNGLKKNTFWSFRELFSL